MLTKNILETALKFIPIASTDQTRFNICGVNIKAVGDKITLTATNGHMLVTREIAGKIPAGEYMIFTDDAPMLKLILKESKHISELECSVLPDKGLLIGTFGSKMTIKTMKDAGQYPDYKQIIPTERGVNKIAFDARYIIALAVALKDLDDRREQFFCTVEFKDHTTPMFVSAKGEHTETTTAVLMPCKI